ncbi:hypothetical protein RM863_35415 [Streptomyces sp. DSM 41014]|uniref:Uncharacterized protein n=1 Tax=Streptomyces hintoniae TaxID=3075521 RepID=A0ABU2UVV2_9ACTN|nr:hypothetical protein [Streptomyces sp. DSM 41014]MDT0477425.1 hypothetical protein [Streptomyces sp. DSM 41014]
MQEITHAETAPDTPVQVPAGHGWCSWHHGPGKELRLITAVEQGSGPGAHHRACAHCRAKYRLIPLGEQR